MSDAGHLRRIGSVSRFHGCHGVSANINGEQRTLLKASVERRYKDPKDGSWKSSTSFSRNELPVLQHLLSRAYGAMLQERVAGADSIEEVLVE
jgi:hypothetical protein